MSTYRKNIRLGTKDPLWGTENIADKAITAPKIADGSVTESKLSEELKEWLQHGGGGGGAGIPDAPKDNNDYVRHNGEWKVAENFAQAIDAILDRLTSIENNISILDGKITILWNAALAHDWNLSDEDIPVNKPAKSTTKTYTGSSMQVAESNEGYSIVGTNDVVSVGTYTVILKLKPGYIWSDGTSDDYVVTLVIKQAFATVTAPTTRVLVFNDREQVLVNAGSCTSGKIQYSLSAIGGFGDTIPTGTAAGDYTVYWKAVLIDTENYILPKESAGAVKATIKPADAVANYGTSASEPTSVDDTNKRTLTGTSATIQITADTADRKRSMWVAVPKGSGWSVTKVVDLDNDSVDFAMKEIGDKVVYHATSLGFISNTYTFTLAKS